MSSPAPRKLSYAPLQPGQIRLLSIDPASRAKAGDKSPIACRLAHCHLEEFAGGWPSTDNESRVWPGSEQSHYDYRSMFDRGMRGKVHFKDGDANSPRGPARKPEDQHHPALAAKLNGHDGDDAQSLTEMYITMSYAWGPPTPTQTIIVDGAETEVTGNLHALLTELRRSEWVRRGVRVWIDALCINQGDNAEKEQQVRIMRRIYEMAWQVVVWLGPVTEHTATAFAAVSWLADAMGTEARLADFWSRNKTYRSAVTPWSMNTYPVFPWRAEVFLALRAFFAQNYWHRLWILQELAMARLDAPVLWGANAVSLRAIYAAARLIESRETEMGQHISSPGSAWNESGVGLLKDRRLHDRQGCPERQWKLLLRIAAMRRTEGADAAGAGGGEHGGSDRSWTDSGGEALIDTLYLSRGAGASEPRDKVYGILGLPTIASTVDISTLAPNYSLASSEVYVNFTRAVLARGDLNTLRFVHSPVGDVLVKWKKTGWVVTGVPILNAAPEPVTPRCPHQLPSWVVCHLCAPPLSVFLSGKYHADLGLGGFLTQETQAQPAPVDDKLLWRCDAVFVDKVATLSAFNFSEADPTYPLQWRRQRRQYQPPPQRVRRPRRPAPGAMADHRSRQHAPRPDPRARGRRMSAGPPLLGAQLPLLAARAGHPVRPRRLPAAERGTRPAGWTHAPTPDQRV
ncbi:Phosphoribosylaminoimidazole-succinocarboxamide synthase [Apiospora rasikravindrae]|uniref:Phosphoribosylaminoimidazole-succinocarboxamide synthase n=1 Tax=Apiospora rasikravindrae TaxID=990691 RepID=A0ABR1SIK7_9PEZI